MLASVVIVTSVLSLLPCAHTLTLSARQTDCAFVCPNADVDGNGFSTFISDDATISCSYFGGSDDSCSYDLVSVDWLGTSHTLAHTPWFRPPVLSPMIITAAPNKPYNNALPAEADS